MIVDETGGDRLGDRLLGWLTDDPTASHTTLTERLRQTEPLLDGSVLSAAVDRALERAHGFGAIGELLRLEGVTEVMINGPGRIWIDRHSVVAETDIELTAVEIDLLIERMLDPLGLRVDRTSPIVDARLPDGSRVNIVVPPLAVNGAAITIRRFSPRPIPLSRFAGPDVVQIVEQLVVERRSTLVVGGTGAGKTTLLNSMGACLDGAARIVVVEDTTELRLPGRHVVRLEARDANSEGVGEVTIRQLVKTALRMRPDRIVIGEVRGSEAFDLVMALNTGHDGSLATCHANDVRGGLRRLETLSLLADADLPLLAIRELIASAFDAVIHVGRFADGSRSITAIASVSDSLRSGPDGPAYELTPLWGSTPERAVR